MGLLLFLMYTKTKPEMKRRTTTTLHSTTDKRQHHHHSSIQSIKSQIESTAIFFSSRVHCYRSGCVQIIWFMHYVIHTYYINIEFLIEILKNGLFFLSQQGEGFQFSFTDTSRKVHTHSCSRSFFFVYYTQITKAMVLGT